MLMKPLIKRGINKERVWIKVSTWCQTSLFIDIELLSFCAKHDCKQEAEVSSTARKLLFNFLILYFVCIFVRPRFCFTFFFVMED